MGLFCSLSPSILLQSSSSTKLLSSIYLDDGTIGGRVEYVNWDLHTVECAAGELGFQFGTGGNQRLLNVTPPHWSNYRA